MSGTRNAALVLNLYRALNNVFRNARIRARISPFMRHPGINERRHSRETCITAFAYRLSSQSLGIQIGITANISASGMCIYSDSDRDVGEIIEIRSSLPVQSLRAAVRWTKKDAADLYKIGLMFIA